MYSSGASTPMSRLIPRYVTILMPVAFDGPSTIGTRSGWSWASVASTRSRGVMGMRTSVAGRGSGRLPQPIDRVPGHDPSVRPERGVRSARVPPWPIGVVASANAGIG